MVGDETYFDGDLFDHAHLCYGEREIYIGMNTTMGNGWFWLLPDGRMMNFTKDSVFIYKRIGTIHEETNNPPKDFS